MKKRAALALFTLLSLMLPGCAPPGPAEGRGGGPPDGAGLHLSGLPGRPVGGGGVEGVSVLRLETGAVSCLHDYTLTVGDMKKLEGPTWWP